MAFVRALDDKRRREGRVNDSDADQLVTMLLEFHEQTIAHTSSGEMSPVVAEPAAPDASSPSDERPPRR